MAPDVVWVDGVIFGERLHSCLFAHFVGPSHGGILPGIGRPIHRSTPPAPRILAQGVAPVRTRRVTANSRRRHSSRDSLKSRTKSTPNPHRVVGALRVH